MNQTIMERWNRVVAPGDKVKIDGEMPDSWWMKLINGKIE